MAKTGPEKIDPRPRAPEVTGNLPTPVSETTSIVESFIQLLQKINDIDDARKALVRAKDLYRSGSVNEARELTKGIFARLKQVGKAPEGLGVGDVQHLIQRGEFDSLSKKLNRVRDAGVTKRIKEAGDLVTDVKELPEMNDTKKRASKNKIKAFVESGRKQYDQQERELQAEFSDFLQSLEARDKESIDAELHNIRLQIDEGLIGEIDINKQVGSLKKSVGETIKKRIDERNLSVDDRDAGVAKALKDSDSKAALDRMVDKVRQSKLGEKALLVKLDRLMRGLDKIEKGAKEGVGLQETIRSLELDEMREMRKFLASISEIEEESERSPYYDEQYTSFIKDMSMKKEDVVAIEKMIDSIDMHYRTEQSVRDVGDSPQRVERQERIKASKFADQDVVFDREGNPAYGMDLGMLHPEDVRALYESGRQHFNELYEEMPDGSFRARNYEQQIQAMLSRKDDMQRQRNEQRESFLNINMNELFDYMRETRPDLMEMIDEQFWLDHQVAKLKDEYMSPAPGSQYAKEKSNFERWWYQEASFQQRSLAYEGLFERRNQSPRMQRLNSLMEIVGVGTEKKGLANWMAMSYQMIDAQNNSYVNAEFMGKLAAFWTNQGVDFRLEDMLKEFREEISVMGAEGSRKIIKDRAGQGASINVFDAVSFMQQEVPKDKELRTKLGIPDWWKGKWGTYIYKYSESGARGKARSGAWEYFMDKELDVDVSSIGPEDKKEISNKYQLMFDLGFNYAVAHKNLHQMLGNASFRKGEFELPAACAEMHLKLDPILYSRAFAPRYTWLNVGFKEGWALFDPGLRDYISMAPQDYAAHFTQFDEKNPTAFETENGSPTILKTFLLGDDKRVATSSDVEASRELSKIFDKALWHWGAGKAKKHGSEMDIFMEWGVDGDKKSAFRRPAGEAQNVLSKSMPSKRTLERINWDMYCDIAKNPRITSYLKGNHTPEEKWNYFAKTFGEQSFNHATPSAKRSGDHPVKYGVESFNKYVETFMAWINDPFNQEKFDALMDVPTAINAGAVPGMAQKNLEFILTMSETMGRRELGGGSMTRLWRNPKDNTTKFDTSKGAGGAGDSEWPSFKTEKITNSKWFFDPVQHKSIPGSVGIGVPEDSEIMLDLIKGQRAKGRLPDDMYRRFYKKIVNGTWYESKKGPIVNLYRWVTLTPLTDWLGSQLGITGYELRNVLWENTEKTGGKVLKHIFS